MTWYDILEGIRRWGGMGEIGGWEELSSVAWRGVWEDISSIVCRGPYCVEGF